MAKIDRRIGYYVMLDTETANTQVDENGNLDMSSVLVYDTGIKVIDKRAKCYEEYSYVIRDTFEDEKELMQSAYYAKKLPQYIEDLENGTRKMVSFFTVRRKIHELMKKYNTNIVIAHNARFDYNALNSTLRYYTKSKYRYFFPYGTVIYDTLKMARQVVAPTPMYRYFCEENGYLTKTGKVKLTAEVLYRFIEQDTSFIESHTGLEDVSIESQIFAYCMAKKKKMEKRLWAA